MTTAPRHFQSIRLYFILWRETRIQFVWEKTKKNKKKQKQIHCIREHYLERFTFLVLGCRLQSS